MKRNALLIVLAGILLVEMGTLVLNRGGSTAPANEAMWISFSVLVPMGLAAIVWLRLRWAAMACVIYGTVGLALDLATAVQIITKDSALPLPLMSSGLSGLLNFLLIVFGGRAFLDVTQAPPPPGSRPPNPPSSFSSAAT